ncbi:MAG TPA: putative 2OG-Fe(II) oxygenase [Rhizomicrobium sp.]|nr:putative 2OG-Fe(II) oxygenase [Rhizomicrobium sp.]
MATPKPQIRSMFPTPVCVHFLPVAQEVNAELRPLIIDRMGATGNASDLKGQGWRSTPDFGDWGGAPAQTLFRVLRELADGVTALRSGARVTLEWKIQAAAIVRQKSEYDELAARPGAMWSGIYFVDDGYGKSDDEALGGELELADPRGALPAMVAPQYGFRIPGGVSAGQIETIRPATGMIILHPSWQPRGERRFEGTSQRVAIEFDLLPP